MEIGYLKQNADDCTNGKLETQYPSKTVLTVVDVAPYLVHYPPLYGEHNVFQFTESGFYRLIAALMNVMEFNGIDDDTHVPAIDDILSVHFSYHFNGRFPSDELTDISQLRVMQQQIVEVAMLIKHAIPLKGLYHFHKAIHQTIYFSVTD